MKIIEQKPITCAEDIGRLNIIDFHRCNGYWENNPVIAMNVVNNWLSGRSSYTIVQEDMHEFPDRGDFPEWHHVGNHYPLGRLYWNMFHASFNGNLRFGDMPDFLGTITFPDSEVQLWGDIGQVSVSTFALEVLPHMNTGDVWVSVLDAHTHILIEATMDIGQMIHAHIAAMIGIK